MPNLETSVVPNFDSIEEMKEALGAKARFEHIDLYPRDGSVIQGEVEERVAELARVESGEALAFNAGMAAVAAAVDTALFERGADRPVLACSREMYTQTKKFVDRYIRPRGVDVRLFESGDRDEVEDVIDSRNPDVLMSETVSNFLNVPILDTDHLLEKIRSMKNPPTVVLDNTLPLSTAMPLGEKITPEDRVIAVESGTKSYTFNQVLMGVAYTKKPELLKELLAYRRTVGSVVGGTCLAQAIELLPESIEDFDERNRRLYATTEVLALAMDQGIRKHNADSSDDPVNVIVSHPILPTHDNHDLYKQQYPDGGAPVLYLQSAAIGQWDLGQALWSHPEVRQHARLSQSFGFDETKIVVDENVGAVRIAGGAKTDAQKLGTALAEAVVLAK